MRDEIDLACCLWGHDIKEMQEDIGWVEAMMKAKQDSRGKAQQNLAVVLAWRLSKTGDKDEVKRRRLLDPKNPRPRWLEPQALIGTHLTEIEACRLLRRVRCRCKKSCQGIKFAREWAKIERARRDLLSRQNAGGEYGD